ncbi:GDP/GTP exchange factor for ARF [Pleosporales sp. CAS-2024a]
MASASSDEAAASARPEAAARALPVAVSPVALVVTECITVTSAMRKHARWAHSSVAAILGSSSTKAPGVPRRDRSGQSLVGGGEPDEAVASKWGLRGKKGKSLQDNPLMSAFARLRNDLKGCRDIGAFDTPAMLHPFLQVIRSSSTSAPITSLALIAITKFLSYRVIGHGSPRLPEAMQQLSSAITHCRFEASDSAADEIVLLRILKLMEGMISGPGGQVLGDESVCEMMETGLSMCCQARLSELLRRSAEIAMVSMCQVIFRRLKTLEIESPEELDALDEELEAQDDLDGLKMDPSANGSGESASDKVEAPQQSNAGSEKGHDEHDSAANPATSSTLDLPATADGGQQQPLDIRPYSLPSIRELFRVLVDLLDPHDRQHTDTMRVMALRIVDVALEVAGPSIASHPSIANLAKDTLCRHLFQLVRSDNMAILNESLRVAGTLLATCRNVLKLQQELYLSYLVACLFPRVEIPLEPGIEPSLYEGVPLAPSLVKLPFEPTPNGRAPPVPVRDRQKLGLEGGARKPDAREAMIENLGGLVRIPSFMAELFVNFDCEIDRGDVCMDIVGLLSRNAFPDSATWSTVNVPPLCLDALLGYVQSIADRLDDEPQVEGFPSAQALREQRAKKKTIIRGASMFNEKPKDGIAFLTAAGIIEDPEDPKCVAKFVKGTTRVDKKVLGEFLAKRGNEAILTAFIELFDFTGQRLDEALRQLLHTFRLPGESALIERIITDFSEQYVRMAQPENIADKDAIYILTYAVIMLNTDQHNPNMKQKRMQYDDFAKNLRGVNGGKDFDPEYLKAIYESIKTREIILPEEHNDRHAYDHAWKDLLVKVQSTSDLVICDTNIFDADMFEATWKPIVATLSYVFMSATDDAVFSRVVLGFDQCAQIAAKYGLSDALDRIISCLSSISTLAPGVPPSTSLNTEVQADKKSVMVSETAVRFGRDGRAQLATVVLFQVIKSNEASIREGWNHLIRIMVNLFVNSLIPPYFLSFQKTLALPPIPLQNPAQIIDRQERPADTGIFSALQSYVSSFANDEPPEPSDQEIEYTLCTVDTVKECHFEDILANISQLPVEALRSLLTSLLEHIPEDGEPRVIVVKPEMPGAANTRPNVPRKAGKGPLYDPSLVFVLELATVLALRDDETVKELAKDVTDALASVIRDTSKHHVVVVARSVYYLLSLLKASNEYDFIRAPVLLHTFSSFNESLLNECSQTILKGLSDCCKGPSALRSELAGSPDFWTILSRLSGVPEAAGDVFKLVEDLTTSTQPGITADNYEAAIAILNDFATAAQIGAVQEQLFDQAARRGKGQKPKKPESNEVVARGSTAMHIVFQLSGRAPTFIDQSHLETTKAYWSPILKTLAHQCLNPCREIRHQAFSSLQRTLLSDNLASPDHGEWLAIFKEVLFPLITQLLKPEVYQSDSLGMSETRVRAATLLSKVFLHYLVLLANIDEGKELLDLWLKIVTIMDRLINSGQGDLEEAVSENLKNMLLVMSNGGYLAPPDEKPEQEEMWTETWKRVNRFLPNFLEELFPEEVGKAKRSREVVVPKDSGGEKKEKDESGEGDKVEGKTEIGDEEGEED